jgi:N-acyl-D-amino-acid deacylase
MTPSGPSVPWSSFWHQITIVLILATVSSADDNPRELTRRAVERSLVVLERGARAYPTNQACFSCHHQTLPLLAMTTARDAKIRIDEELLREQQAFTRTAFEERKARLAKGEHIGGRAATVSFGLWTMHLTGDEKSDLTEAMTHYLLSVQHADGYWKAQSTRPPLEGSLVSCTVLTAISLQRYAAPSQQERATEAVSRAKSWLATATLAEQEDQNFALWAQKLLDGNEERRNELIERIIAARNADGGWSQLTSLTSDAYATGQTLYVLLESGLSPDDAAIREGIAYLLETQEEDGSWHVVTRSKPIQPWFDNGDPHGKDQFISITAMGWAASALARSLRN